MNTDAPWPSADQAWARVLTMQTRLHRWAATDHGRRFDDVFNLVHDPAFLVAAWTRVRDNKGARTAGVDGLAPRDVPGDRVLIGLARLREQIRTGMSPAIVMGPV